MLFLHKNILRDTHWIHIGSTQKVNFGVEITKYLLLIWSFYGPVNTVEVMSGRSVNLLILYPVPARSFEWLTSTVHMLSPLTDNCPYVTEHGFELATPKFAVRRTTDSAIAP